MAATGTHAWFRKGYLQFEQIRSAQPRPIELGACQVQNLSIMCARFLVQAICMLAQGLFIHLQRIRLLSWIVFATSLVCAWMHVRPTRACRAGSVGVLGRGWCGQHAVRLQPGSQTAASRVRSATHSPPTHDHHLGAKDSLFSRRMAFRGVLCGSVCRACC